MNGNLSFGVLPNGQQFVQTVGLGSHLLPPPQQPQQQFISVQNGIQPFNLNNGAFPVHNFQQGMAIGVGNQQMQTSSPAYTCINQNGMTYLAFTPPSIPQPQPCYQAIQTPQGLQLVQVINNHANFNPFCVQNGPQNFFTTFNQQQGPGLQQMQVVPSVLESQLPQFQSQPSNQNAEKYKQEELNPEEDYPEVEDNQESSAEDSSNCELQEEEEENSTATSDEEPAENSSNTHKFEPVSNLVAEVSDPLAALTSLTSSIPTFNSNTSQQSADHNVFTINSIPPSLTASTAQQENSTISMGDQQFPPNTRAFQVLVPTPQGMAIQTVVASYPTSPPPPMMHSMSNNSSFMNLDPTLTPQLIDLPLQQQMQVSSLPPQTCSSGVMLPISSTDVTNGVTVTAPATRTTSPCHSTTAVIQQKPQTLAAAQITLTEVAALPVATPSGSPHYLPDSTDDLYQPTIKQSTLNVVDGINLEEIREFARTFKMRRLVLGLTQTQVGQALSATEGPAYSQSAICRFEKLDITPRSALKIRPVLENWLREAEEKQQQGQGLFQPSGLEYLMCPTSAGKVRKRRTFFSAEALVILTAHFDRNAHPSGREINTISSEIGYDRDVVRVWFCNKRQSLRNNNTPQNRRSIGSNKATSSPTSP